MSSPELPDAARRLVPKIRDARDFGEQHRHLDPDVLAAMRHDKKRAGGAHRFVLLEAVGRPLRDVEVPDDLLEEVVAAAVAAGE